ncbi:amidohydrolase [Terrilactibacillus sp. BCM23-1]|uniref:Amidohydrolase n=1 Tax=Terrilactibacillus tamarindi TaxID=2599694 RepID=A0A6N8CKZ2_9BACI|nr:M20 family metallopeptidase [Terrilactibacillus tamarindi]MTT30489.1 amidohydrolase [Terrilactibacillus tamarindi]
MISTWHERIEELYDQMVEWRRFLHQHPELSYQEVKTRAFIVEKLESFGIEVKDNVGGGGVVGIIRGGKPGKTIALRADFDALFIQDEKDVPYKSTVPGVMHACGHDGHTSTLLNVAQVLSEHRHELEGNVILLHQHAEEMHPGGAKPMIQDGCLDGVDLVFGTHLWSTIPYGQFGYNSGDFMAAADALEIKIQGLGGHGSAPHQSVDAIVIGAEVINQLQLIVSRQVDPLKSAVISFGSFQAGSAANIIADTATFKGTVRTFDESVRAHIEKQIPHIVEHVCEAFHATCEVTYSRGYDAVVNHEKESKVFKKIIDSTFGKGVATLVPPLMGGEDFAYYLQERPGMFFLTGAGNPEVGAKYPHHHPKFNFDERAMLMAGKAFLSIVDYYLCPQDNQSIEDEKFEKADL